MNAIDLLLGRNSATKLREPAPDAESLALIFQAALRAPDHARLRPWRFLTIQGHARQKLGELYLSAMQVDATESEKNRAQAQPLRAPLIVVVIAKQIENTKVPNCEQLLSAACAAHAVLLAAQALGYAGVWRTGNNAYDKQVMAGLGLAENELIVGFIYLGSIDGDYKPLPDLDIKDYVANWQ